MHDRDIRLTERQIFHGRDAVARRIRELERRIDRTSYAGKPGMKDSVLSELAELRGLHNILDRNFRAIGRQLAELVNATQEAR